jgi:putative Holliday junction resolvase
MKYLGIDWGMKKIGIAIGDDETRIASPAMTLRFHGLDEVRKKITELIERDEVGRIVIGDPIGIQGQEKVSAEFEEFKKIVESCGAEVVYEDERLTTKLAQVLKRDLAGSGKVEDDEIAAMAILQTYFEKL